MSKINTKNKVSTEFVAVFEKAFNVLNAKLFQNRIPACMITFNRNRMSADGMFIWNSFYDSQDSDTRMHEIALNTDNFSNHDPKFVLSVLVHEMVHAEKCMLEVEKNESKRPARTNSHTKQFAKLMLNVGLIASSTGCENGADTGNTMSQYWNEDSIFSVVADDIISKGFDIAWYSEVVTEPVKKKQSKKLPLDPSRASEDTPVDESFTVDDSETLKEIEQEKIDSQIPSNQKPKKGKIKYTCNCSPPVYANVEGLDITCNKCSTKFTAS